MPSKRALHIFAALVAFLVSGVSNPGYGAEDKSGTNPIAFTNDLRAYYEYQDLENGHAQIGTLEARTPFLDGEWQARVRVPFKEVDTGSGSTSISESGLGDINARFLTVPYLDPKSGFAFAAGLEVFLPTAGEDALGEGKFSLGPQAFAVWFNPFGIKDSLISPAVQQVFSIAGDGDRKDVQRTQMDLYLLKQSEDKRFYGLLDPQLVIDWNAQTVSGQIEAEGGYVLESGLSFYIRPGIGLGGETRLDANLETGIKYIF